MTYIGSQNYIVVTIWWLVKHEIQTFKVVVVVLLFLLLSFDVFVPTSARPYYFWTSGLPKYT